MTMIVSRCWFLLALRAGVLLLSCVARVEAAKSHGGTVQDGWKCDDMTPNLCDDLAVTTGSFVSPRGSGALHIHYWRYSASSSSNNVDDSDNDGSAAAVTAFPIVVVNGGPGMAHEYNLPLRQLACRRTAAGRDVIFYDQGGTGKSALPPNTTVANDFAFLLDASYYAEEELPALIKALGLNYYHLVGDSWGTMIIMQNVIHKRDPKLLSLTLNGPVPNISDYVSLSWDPVEGSIGTLPAYIKERMRAIETSQDFESKEMEQITTVVFANFYARNGLTPDCVAKAFTGANEEITLGMWGAVDFFDITGTLKDFNLWPDIKNGALNEIPTLLTSGRFDMVRPITVNEMWDIMPLSEEVLFPDSGHVSVLDATGELLNAIHSFLTRVEIAETEEGIVFTPKRLGEEEGKGEAATGILLQTIVAIIVVIVTFLLGAVVGRYRGARQNTQYTQIV